MLQSAKIPATQLHSAAARYVGVWAELMADQRQPELAGGAPDRPAIDGQGDPTPAADAESNLARLEAVLFLSREPLTSRKLSLYANLADGTQARTLIRRLNERYDAAGRAFRVEQVAGGFQLLTRRKLAPWLRRLAHVPGETRLSAPALETLAVIAYRQPVPRADIEAIRGVNCGEILRQLMDRDLVRIGGRSEELGRPYLYATTKRFLQVFGLNNAEELPDRDVLRGSPLPAAPPVIPAASEPAGESSDDAEADANLADGWNEEFGGEEYQTDFSDG
jgi:segregation and condensation protein B